MTIAERKRARALRDVLRAYTKGGSIIPWLMIALAAVIILLAFNMKNCIVLDKLFKAALVGALLMSLVVVTLPCQMTAGIGDNTNSVEIYDKFGSTAFMGKFLCTLPFYASDLQNLRMIQWELTAAASVVVMTGTQIFSIIAENRGYTMLRGYVGLAVIWITFAEIIGMVMCFVKKNWKLVVSGALFGVMFYQMVEILHDIGDVHEDAAAMDERLSGLGFLYGVPGIIIYAIVTILIGVIGENYLKKKEIISWHLH